MNHTADAIDILFKRVSSEVYERPTYGHQATNEIVKDLIQKGFETYNIEQEIKLTSKGLDKCKKDCK